MNIPFVDSHCHLDLYADYKARFADVRKAGSEILAVTTTPLAWEQNRLLAAGASNIEVGLGLHPQLIADTVADLSAFERALPSARFIGEVGLDAGPQYYKTLEHQRRVFGRILQLCKARTDYVVSIHCVRAFKEMFALLDAHWTTGRGTLIFHWFSGSVAEAQQAIDRNCFFSINPQMARSDNALRIIKNLPLDRLLTETDGPFTEASAKSPRAPGDVQIAVDLIAKVKKISVDDARKAAWDNWMAIKKPSEPVGHIRTMRPASTEQASFGF